MFHATFTQVFLALVLTPVPARSCACACSADAGVMTSPEPIAGEALSEADPAYLKRPRRMEAGALPSTDEEALVSSDETEDSPAPRTVQGWTPVGTEALKPPGLVHLRGGTTYIGASQKEIQALIEASPGAADSLRALDAETPQRRVAIRPFFYGLTEVTHEQYAAFARATGYRPHQDWGADAIEAGRMAWFEEMNRINQERRAANKPVLRETFEATQWWDEHWRDAEWDLPADLALMPVAYVNYADTLAYCRWAGVRLPEEAEYQHAVRGTSKDPYPWGSEWVTGEYCGTNEVRGHAKPYYVAHFDKGKSKSGLYELAGNVWEWTSSPYVAPPEFKKNKYKVPGKKEKEEPQPKWDGNQRVVVGGSFQNSKLVARCTVRRPTDRTQITNALGFRVASTAQAGFDIATAILREDVKRSEHRPTGITYDPGQVVAMDRWESAEGTEGAPDGYSVIARYEYLLFVPIGALDETQDASFRRDSLKAPAHLGFLSLSEPMIQPELDVGTYLVAFRAAGKIPEVAPVEGEEKDQPAKAIEDPLVEGLDLEADNLLLIDTTTGKRAAFFPIKGVAFAKGDAGGSWGKTVKTHMEVDPNDPRKQIKVSEDWLRCDVRIGSKIRRRSLIFSMEMMPHPSHFARNWRQ